MSGNNTVPGAAPAGAVPASGYYSRPDLWEDAQKYTDEANATYLRMKHFEGGLQTQAKEIEGMGNALRFLQRRFQLAEKAGDTAQMESIKLHYDEVYSQMRRADLAYAKIYGDYERAYSGYQTAWNAQNTYITGQREAEKQWRSTIRDPETVQAELAAIEGQIAAQRETDRAKRQAEYEARQDDKPWYEKLAGYLGEIQDTTLPTYPSQGGGVGPASPELKELLEKQKLLQEEYEWAMYLPYADLMQAEDFAENSVYKRQERKEQKGLDILMDNYSDGTSGWEDPLYEYINGNKEAGAYLSNAGAGYYGPDNTIGEFFGRATENKAESQQMTEDEIAIFNYLYATQGRGAAHNFYSYLQSDLNYRQRKAEEDYWKEEAQKKPWGTSAFSVAMSPLRGLSYVGQLSDYIGDGKIDQNAAYNKFSYTPSAIREQVSQDIKDSIDSKFWGKAGSFGYQTAMSIADFLTTTLVSGGNSTLARTIMGSGVAADTVINAKDRGLNDNQAFALGTIAGVAEAVTEKYSLDALLDKTSLRKSAAGYIFKNVLAEGSEEVASSLINTMADVLISQDKSQWQQAIDAYMAQGKTEGQAFGLALADQTIALGLDALGGALSGGLMAGGNVAITKTGNAIHNKAASRMQTVPQAAPEVGNVSEPVSFQEEVQRQVAENIAPAKPAQGTVDTDRALGYDNTVNETKGGGISNEEREETREAFHRRANEKVYTVRERGEIACGFHPAVDKTERAGRTEKALQELGIQVIVHEGLEINTGGKTRLIQGESTCVGGDAVYVRNSTETDPMETAGHEAYHFWKRTDARTVYEETVADNIDFASDAFVDFQQKIEKAYFGEEVGIEDDGVNKLVEEIFAYITGLIHSGNGESIVRPFLRDYDAVKAAWDALVDAQASTAAQATFQAEVQRQVTENLGGKKAAQGATAELAAPTVQVSQEVWQQGQRLAEITGRNIKFYEGKVNENGFYDAKTGEIWVNAKGGDPLAQVFSHELTHSIEQAGAYEKLAAIVLNRMQDTGINLDNAREAKRQQYERQNKPLPSAAAVDQELVAEYVSRHLLTNEQEIVSLVQQDRTLGQKIRGLINKLLAKLGNKNAQERAFLSKARDLYAKALRQTQNVGAVQAEGQTVTAAEEVAAGDTSLDDLDAQLAAGEITDEEYDHIRESLEEQQEERYTAGERKYSINENAASELEKVLKDKNYQGEVLLRDETPPIMLAHKGLKNLPMTMNASHIRENIFTEAEAEQRGLRVDEHTHYHGIGKEMFLKIIDGLDHVTEAYRGTKNADNPSRRENYFLLVSQYTDSDGNVVNVPVYVNEKALSNRVFIDTNKISTVFGRSGFREYIQRQVQAGNLVRIKNKSAKPSESNALIARDYRNDASSDSIRNPDGVVNTQYSISEKNQVQGNTANVREGTSQQTPALNTDSIPNSEADVKQFSLAEELTEATAEEKSDVEATEAKADLRSTMPKKAKTILDTSERSLLTDVTRALHVPSLVSEAYLAPIVQELSDIYLDRGTLTEEDIGLLADKSYASGVVACKDYLDQYSRVAERLRSIALTPTKAEWQSIFDTKTFKERSKGNLRIVAQGGMTVAEAFKMAQEIQPDLFPEDMTTARAQAWRLRDVVQNAVLASNRMEQVKSDSEAKFREAERGDFANAVSSAVSKLWEVKRYAEDKAAKDSDVAPATAAEAMEAYGKLKKARREFEKASAKNLLTERDQQQVGRLLRHEISLSDLQPGVDNVKGITAVFEAKQEYEKLCKLIIAYKRYLRGQAKKKADALLKTANDWKDKRMGIAYSRETMERNIYDIVPDKALAKQIIDQYFTPVHQGEAAANRFRNEYRERVKALDLSRKVEKGNLVSEAHAVQLLGEAEDNIRMLENARGRIKQRDGKNLSEWQAVVGKLWAENPNLDRGKIEGAVKAARQIYDELLRLMNEVRVANGYEPINYRSGYFPHFQPGNSDSILAQFGRALGIDTRIDALPTTINGLTHTFKPGIQWFGNAQERLGFNTAYDMVEGFDKYIEGCASVIFHTENIQNLRALASQIRYRTSDEGIRQQVDEIYERQGITDEEKQQLIQEVYAHGKFSLSNFVTELDEYTNLLANKKSRYDRAIEAAMGRRVYTILKAWEARVGANMIAGNLTSALTNFIPWTQAGAQVGYVRLLRGVAQTLEATRSDDGFAGGSTFLTNRRGVDPLVQTWAQKASGYLSKLSELIDGLVSESIVRAAYEQNRQQGLSEAEAMAQADAFAASVMADRSKGAMPTLMQASNPLFKAFTQFQLEVNNQFSEVFKDIPRRFKEKGLAALAWVLLKYFLGALLYNWLYEKLIGRRPALDPIGMLCEAYDDLQTDGFGTAGKNLAVNALEQLPFSSGLTMIGVELDGGRIPASSAVPDFTALWDAATTEGWSAKKRWKEVQDELNKLAYVVPPFGGNQISKVWKGVKAYIQGGSYNVDAAGNDILQYPVYKDEPKDAFWSLVKAAFLGKSALGTAQDWVDNGFDSLGAKQAAAYQDMIASGVKDRDAYALIQSIQGAQESADKKKAAVQRDVLRASKVSGDGKAIVYYGLLASDKERELMDSLADLGADAGAVANALMDLKDAGSKAVDKLGTISKAKLTDEEKAVLVGSVIGTELLTESGGLTQYAKFDYAVQNGMSVDQYISYRSTGANIDDYLKLRDAGASIEEAMETGIALQELRNSVEDPTTIQRWRAVIGSADDPETQMASLSVVMTDAQYAKALTARGFGVSPKAYVEADELLRKYDADGNGSFTQAEVTRAVSTMRVSVTQKAVLWQLMTGSSSAEKNPYNAVIGQRVIDALKKAKAESEKKIPSFQDEIMRQIMGNFTP